MKTRTILLFSFILLANSFSHAQIWKDSNAMIDAFVDSIYNSMTMEERVAQLHGVRSKLLIDENGNLSLEKCRELIPHGVGHVAQFASTIDLSVDKIRKFVKDLQHYLMTETRTAIPAIFHEEAITGLAARGATTFPQQIGVASSWNPKLVELKSKYTAESMRSVGATMALSPMIDIVRTQHFNRAEESYGEDSYLTSALGNAFMKGLIGRDLRNGIEPCSKHYLGYGGGSDLPIKEMIEEIITPHEVGIRVSGNKAIMPGYHSYKGESSIMNKFFLKDLLRDYIGFDGLIVSDYFAIKSKWNDTGDPDYSYMRAEKAINAGADLELCDLECFSLLPELIEQGRVSEQTFKDAVKRNLIMKYNLGLLDKNPKFFINDDLELDNKQFRSLAYKMASQSVVLLKNNGILPLKKNIHNIALIGPNANSYWAMLGDYTFQAHHTFFQGKPIDGLNPKVYTLKEGMELSASKGRKVVYERGFNWDDKISKIESSGDTRIKLSNLQIVNNMLSETADVTSWAKAEKYAKENDVIVVAVGENLVLCGEGRNRAGIRLPGKQEEFVEELIDSKKPVVVVIFGGREQVLSKKILDGAAAILQAWYPGEEGGKAVADIIYGKVNPSAKLPMSYPATDKNIPLCYNYGKEKMKDLVAFPFGYGLSYSKFEYSNFQSPKSVTIGKDTIDVSFTLKNTSSVDGDEISQLYIMPTSESQQLKPIQLKGFIRTNLKSGESKKVMFKFVPELISMWNGKEWNVNPGEYKIAIGSSSDDLKFVSKITLKGNVSRMKIRNAYFSECYETKK